MNTIVEFYEEHEWLRWILFLPLIFLAQALFMLIVHIANFEINNSWIFEYVISFAISGGLWIFLTFLLAPRWHNGFAWFWIILGGIGFLAGIANIFLEFEGYSYSETISAFVWVIVAYITKRKMNQDLINKM